MTTSESSTSVHLQCLKNNCLSESQPTKHSPDKNLQNLDTDPSKSPSNNNNNNSSADCISYPAGGSNICSSFGSPTATLVNSHATSLPSNIVSPTVCSNSCCSNSPSKIGLSAGPPAVEPTSNELPGNLENAGGEKECLRNNLKISENHLSTKVVRTASSPYSIPNPVKAVGLAAAHAHVRQNQDQSNHSPANPSGQGNVSSSSSSGPFMTPIDEDEDQVMFDNVSHVNSLQVNHHCSSSNISNGVGSSSNINSGGTVSSNSISNLMGSTSILGGGSGSGAISSNGMIHTNNMSLKQEPNGNSIELTSGLDNQFLQAHQLQHQLQHHQLHQLQQQRSHLQQANFQQHQPMNGSSLMSAGGNDCGGGGGLNPPSHSPLVGETLNAMQTHETAFMNNHGSNGSGSIIGNNQQLCQHNGGLFANSCVHNSGGMSLVAGNGSIGSMSGNSNCAGSMTSPGGSLDEHDCDDDK
jgi:hypothetical protein